MFIGLGRGPPGRGAALAGVGRELSLLDCPPPPPGRGAWERWPPRSAEPPPRSPVPEREPPSLVPPPWLPWPPCGPGLGLGLEPMPVAVDANGLFPGRGPDGRAPLPPPSERPVPPSERPGPRSERPPPGLAGPGFGAAGRGPGLGVPPEGLVGRAGVSVDAGSPPSPVESPVLSLVASPVSSSMDSLGSCTGAGADSDSDSALGCFFSWERDLRAPPLFCCCSVFAGAEPLPLPLLNASLSRRTTGASIVEDADRTNSPISLSLASTTLLSTPNSFASSYTRTFATALLYLGPGHGIVPDRR